MVSKKKNKKFKLLSSTELQDRATLCMEGELCFITKEPLNKDNSIFIKHSEAGMVLINGDVYISKGIK
jgi:hypothetical protein